MSREPKGQGDYSQGRIGITAGGKYRAAGDEKIRHAVHSAIAIDHAVPGIVVHPGSAEEVMGAVESSRLGADSFLHRDESAEFGGSQILPENLLRLADAAQVQLVPAPEDLDFTLAEGIGLLLQHHAIGAVRRLLDEGADAELVESAFHPGDFRPAAMALRIILFKEPLPEREARLPACSRGATKLRGKPPAEKPWASDQELAQDGQAVGSQILEMRHKHRAKIEHFLPADHIRADVQFPHYRLPSYIVLIVKLNLFKKRAGERN